MKIVQMLQPVAVRTGVILLGLGDDSKVYAWDTKTGMWKPNWDQAPAIKPKGKK